MRSLFKINPLYELSFSLLFILIIVINIACLIMVLYIPMIPGPRPLEGKLLVYLPKIEVVTASAIPIHLTYNYNPIYNYNPYQRPKSQIEMGDKECSDWDDLSTKVSQIYQDNRTKNKDISFIIDGPDNIPFQEIINALNSLKKAGIADTNIELQIEDQPK